VHRYTNIFYFVFYFSCLNGCVGWWLCSKLWAWNGLFLLNTYTALYPRTNRCYNERGCRTNYVRSIIPHCIPWSVIWCSRGNGRGRNSVAVVATRLQAERSGVRIPARETDFLLQKNRPYRLWGPPSILLNTYPGLKPRLRTPGTVPLHSLHALTEWTGRPLPFFHGNEYRKSTLRGWIIPCRMKAADSSETAVLMYQITRRQIPDDLMARPQVADEGTASNMEGSCEYINPYLGNVENMVSS
jgi:hypothetical protein